MPLRPFTKRRGIIVMDYHGECIIERIIRSNKGL